MGKIIGCCLKFQISHYNAYLITCIVYQLNLNDISMFKLKFTCTFITPLVEFIGIA